MNCFEGVRENVTAIYSTNFENDSSLTAEHILEGNRSEWVDKDRAFTKKYGTSYNPGDSKWIRASARFHSPRKEWNFWHMPQFIVEFSNGGQSVKKRAIRLHRFMNDGSTKRLFIDVRVPNQAFDKVEVFLWNADGAISTYMDELVIEGFN